MNGESSKGKRKVCRYCAKQIPVQAFVCHNCGWHQNRFWQHFRFEHFGLIIALAMMGLAYLQFREARKERIAATDALQLARQAEAAALNTAADIEKVYTEVAHHRKKILTVSQTAIQVSNQIEKVNEILRKAEVELTKLKERNRLTVLGDKMIAEGNRSAFDELNRLASDSSDSPFRLAAMSEKLRAYSFYGDIEFMGALDKLEYTTSELIDILLNDDDWQRRAASARILKSRKGNNVIEAFVDCIRQDQNLHVVILAIKGFKAVSGHQINDVLGFEEVYDWWEDHNKSKGLR